jgi:uncharacterized protein (TIGR04552 family)
MTEKPIRLDARVDGGFLPGGVHLADLEALRLVLRGGSTVDWYRPNFRTHKQIRSFLKVNGYDTRQPLDEARLRQLIQASTEYLHDTFSVQFPKVIREPEAIEDLFLLASTLDSPHQKLACMTLKSMHVINHLEGRELGHRLSVSDRALFGMAEQRVSACVTAMRRAGIGVHQYQASRKPQSSLITKLLSKRRTIAAQIYDKVRFRIITRDRSDIVPALLHLNRHLLPFNYVVPEETRNDIINFRTLVEAAPDLHSRIDRLQFDLGLEERLDPALEDSSTAPFNPATSESYRVINFVIDLPVRVDKLLEELGTPATPETGFIVFVLVEFQVFDRQTFETNEDGPASHARYKNRQKEMVLRRLVQGMPATLRAEQELDWEIGPTPSNHDEETTP